MAADEWVDGFSETDTDEQVEQMEATEDDKLAKVVERLSKTEQKLAAKDAAEESDRMVSEFYSTVPDELRPLADIWFTGVKDPDTAKKAIASFQPKIDALPKPEGEEVDEEDDKALSAPVVGEPVRPVSAEDKHTQELWEKVQANADSHALAELLGLEEAFRSAVAQKQRT